ncbi:MAG TPA: hypothetical protein VNP92_18375 [Actinophytocola sp.]|nr:hypothetical protein [Actinophytocola sp.]
MLAERRCGEPADSTRFCGERGAPAAGEGDPNGGEGDPNGAGLSAAAPRGFGTDAGVVPPIPPGSPPKQRRQAPHH